MKSYCIFKVYDYKGGELISNVNLTYKNFIGELSELFDNIDFDSIKEKRDKKIKKILDDSNTNSLLDQIKSEIKSYMKSDEFYSEYAGGDGFCGDIYEVENNKLKLVDIEDYIDDIAKHISENWF